MAVSFDSATFTLPSSSSLAGISARLTIAEIHAEWLVARAAHDLTESNPSHQEAAAYMMREGQCLHLLAALPARTDDELIMKCAIMRFIADTSSLSQSERSFCHSLISDALALSEGRRIATAEAAWPEAAE